MMTAADWIAGKRHEVKDDLPSALIHRTQTRHDVSRKMNAPQPNDSGKEATNLTRIDEVQRALWLCSRRAAPNHRISVGGKAS